MKKLLFILFSVFFGIFSVNAGTYTGWEHKNVSTLPEASSDTLGYIYNYNDKYYVTRSVSSNNELYSVDDILKNNDSLIFKDTNLREKVINYLVDNNCTDQYNSNCKLFEYSGLYSYFFSIFYKDDSINYYYYDNSSTSAYMGNLKFDSDVFVYKLYFIKNSDSYPAKITKIYNNYLTSVLFKSLGSDSFEWLEIKYSDWFEFNILNNDYYLFYSFTDISSFDIFSWVDFTSFTDFEKVCTVCMFNILFSISLILFIYIFLKAFNKLISWFFR